MKFKKLSLLAVAGIVSVSQVVYINAASDAPQVEGDYTAKIKILKDGSDETSMSDVFFDRDAEISIKGNDAYVSIYVANPVPGFDGYEQTLSDVVVGKDDGGREAKYEIKAAEREMDIEGGMMPDVAGTVMTTDKITLHVDKDELLEDSIDVTAAINPGVMGMVQNFDLEVSDYIALEEPEEPEEPEVPEIPETETKTVPVTATVKLNQSTYEVIVPSTIDIGNLTVEDGGSSKYEVEVDMKKGNDGLKVLVETEEEGSLTAGDHKIKFSNEFGQDGSKTFTESEIEEGTLKVDGSQIEGVSSGTTYDGILNFNIKTTK